MCITALPEHLNSVEEIENNFKDDDQFGVTWYGRLWRRYRKWLKPHLAFGPRDVHWYHRCRVYPKTLLALRGNGPFRLESDGGNDFYTAEPYLLNRQWSGSYLSRIQYYCRWHIQIQWPLFICIHWYTNAQDVPLPNQAKMDTDGKILYFYIGMKRDADNYWLSLFVGRNWK